MRKSFVLHIDSLDVLDELTDEQAGKLFKAIKSFNSGSEIELDSITKIVMVPFKAQFIRDNEKYSKKVEVNKINGLKGGRPKANNNQIEYIETENNHLGFSGIIQNPEKGDSDSDSDSDSDRRDKDVGDKSPVPLQQVLDAYHELLPMMPVVLIYTEKRKSMVRTFWKKRTSEHKAVDRVFTIDSLRSYFNYIANHCQWMLTARDNGKGGVWKAKNFDYVMKEDCYVAVKEQRFDNKVG